VGSKSYQETIDFLFEQLPMFQRIGQAAYKADLSTSLAIDQYLNHPHKNYPCIHVAGTNGKGSVSSMLASVYSSSGLKVGLFTSPHLKDFRERITINGEKITEKFVIDFVEKHQLFFKDLNASFFEYTTAMAMEYFKSENIDLAIFETGMGGRLDSTNVVNPLLSIITNISLDHTQFLGNTLEAIAVEKAGIIKAKIPVLIGERQIETEKVFVEKAKAKDSPLHFSDEIYEVTEIIENFIFIDQISFKNKLDKQILKISPSLKGKYQSKNIQTVLSAIDILKHKIKISESDIKEGLEKVHQNTLFKGRWQVLNTKPLVVCDAAHNPAGIKEVIDALLEKLLSENLIIVLATTVEKDLNQLFSILPKKAKYYFSEPDVPRKLDKNRLQQEAISRGFKGEIYESINIAYQKALSEANDNQVIYIGGSIFTIAEVC
jgi:dihydrofolate synthase / folylpolyglutamate synthase